ncbi:Rv3654c family TadE-like protein [Phycicoccus duodecadis]|uniref:Secretion/DNA translocation related TadE-like protein n=1 Tax=Phycicoccus duodecadis TaxID=173053 RepID=A0A2N3YI44_9MICO|nr:Rv3654c family TadE-like protein [Phycicoccus duodecadis]PKW26509.1 secretion/DNA translocation related TadE-like protein [Phycicoccus duodecadis]
MTSRSGWGAEQGSASVLVLAALGVLASVLVAAVVLAAAVRDTHRASNVADRAALAAAAGLLRGGVPDCDAAGEVARAGGAVVVSCVGGGGHVTVEAAVPLRARSWWPGLPATARGDATAGLDGEAPR